MSAETQGPAWDAYLAVLRALGVEEGKHMTPEQAEHAAKVALWLQDDVRQSLAAGGGQ